MRKNLLLFGLCWLWMLPSAMAAKRLEPPVEFLLANPERNKVVVAVVSGKVHEFQLAFTVSEQLSGTSPAELVLRSDATAWSDVAVGQSYVLVWSTQRRNRSVIGGWEEDPAGPSLVEVMGLGSLALFEDNADMRRVFAPGAATGNAGQFTDALLSQLQRPDSRSRGLVAAELYLRADLTAGMTAAQAEDLKRVIGSGISDPQHSDFLLRAALDVPSNLTAPWLAEACRRVIIVNGSQYDLSSYVPGLARTAAQCLQQVGAATDVELLSSLLYSNNPGVAKAAFSAMTSLNPAASREYINQALQRNWALPETRSVMQDWMAADSP